MNTKKYLTFILGMVFLLSCRKYSDHAAEKGFVKSLPSDFDAITVGSVLLKDNSVITVCRSRDFTFPGSMYKVDAEGKLVWKKELNARNKGCYQVYDTKGDGFVVVGFENTSDLFFQVFRYDDDGNFLGAKEIYFSLFWYHVGFFSTIQMLELHNGNFVFAFNEGNMHLRFTNNTFDTLYKSKHKIGKYTGSFVRGIYQTTDTTLLFANSVGNVDPWNVSEMDLDVQLNQVLTNGSLKSQHIFGDSVTNETPNLLLPMGNGMLLVTSKMGPFNTPGGIVVNYLNNWYTKQVSGEINLVKLTGDGKFISRQTIRDYPGNGMIMNGRPTADGGIILCGTVGQSDALFLVSPTKIYLLKLDASGKKEWSRIYNTTNPSYGTDVQQTADGGYFICGHEKFMDNRYAPIIIKTDKYGNL